MKTKILTVILFITTISFSQERNQDSINDSKIDYTNFTHYKNIKLLAEAAKKASDDKKEQLNILLHWAIKNITGDSDRFFNGGEQQNIETTIKRGKGLCEEYTLIFNEYCKLLNISSIRVDGYVKPFEFKENDKLQRANHTWNAVYLDQRWYICDLFWSTSTLDSKNVFKNKINPRYFLSEGDVFIEDHLPCDPIFQFLDNPIKIEAFTNLIKGYNKDFKREESINYDTEIKKLLLLNKNELKLTIARNTYNYNKDNPNSLIEELYNFGVEIINNKSSTSKQLTRAKAFFKEAKSLIPLSNKEDIKQLDSECSNGIKIIEKRLS